MLYDFFRASPSSAATRTASSWDRPTTSSRVKTPARTLADKGGTSLDLALLFASLSEAAGLESGVGLVPGGVSAGAPARRRGTLPLALAAPRQGDEGGLDAAYAEGRRQCAARDIILVFSAAAAARMGLEAAQ